MCVWNDDPAQMMHEALNYSGEALAVGLDFISWHFLWKYLCVSHLGDMTHRFL